MQYTWIKRSVEGQQERLLVIALGWAAGAELVDPACFADEDGDVLCLYDYRDMELKVDLRPYRRVDVVAWSFGVWVAERVLGGDPRLADCTAINGTPLPVNVEFGIHPKAFELTVRGIERGGIDKFLDRMCGSEQIDRYRQRAQLREISALSKELQTLGKLFTEEANRPLPWNRAVVGMQDQIFPPQAVLRYWQEHYPQIELRQIDNMPHLWMPGEKSI